MAHIPVLLNEVLEIFNPQAGEAYIDATINGGGHARSIAEKVGEDGAVWGIDLDCELIEKLKIKNQELGINNINLICENYANLADIVRQYHVDPPRGILFDLGFSFYHIAESQRGFSFQKNEPLDMRYSPSSGGTTASDIIRKGTREELEKIFCEYGEERYSGRIAEAIAEERRRHPIETTFELIAVVRRAVPRSYEGGRIHPATRVFQALRIAVNDEFENIRKGIGDGFQALRSGGKLAVISFHSGEDRIVKNLFRDLVKAKEGLLLIKKPITASPGEIARNSHARSAKLRAIQKL
ncbi:MAG: 16S rRNA (cytosine(1402)-N(4))-methyltransferase RsmH [bacterium]|nr:16S rRNA (cytosine(1402)-N(4))-methyltransferase RsmH [bacterium]